MVQTMRQIPDHQREQFTPACDEPLLLKGWAREWPASAKWNLDYFASEFGEEVVPLSNYTVSPYKKGKDKPHVALRDYISFLRSGASDQSAITPDCYLAGWHFMRTAPRIMQDIHVPACFRENVLDHVTQGLFPFDSISLFIGHERVESPLHTDSFGVSVWLANVVGRKTIRVVPPVDYQRIKNGMDVFSDDVAGSFEANGIPVVEATLEAGDIVFIPPGHWHHVRNHSFTIAISTNFVSRYHFLPFEQQLRAKIMIPYMKLLELKEKVLEGSSAADFSPASAEHFRVLDNESKFLDFMQQKLSAERARVAAMRQRCHGQAGD